jgi:hypothetical protein
LARDARRWKQSYGSIDAMLDKDEVARFVADAIRQVVATGRKQKKK